MKDITPPKVIEHDPNAKMRPAPITPARQALCLCVAVALTVLGFYWIVGPLEAGKSGGKLITAGIFVWFGAAILYVSALFPNFTLAREKRDRRR